MKTLNEARLMKNILINMTPIKAIKRRLTSCCLLIVLAFLLACGLFFGLSAWLVSLVQAQTPAQAPYDVLLLIDNSNSMFEKNGLGSDPDLLRIEAARLFFNYLGVDSGGVLHRLGVIFFGGEAHLVVPLTPLADDTRRVELAQLISKPARMNWTNPQVALELAETTLNTTVDSRSQQAVVLLTDGKPEWGTTPSTVEKQAVHDRLQKLAQRFADQEIPLFIVLLQSPATDADPEIDQVYLPLWQQMAKATPPGRFYLARQSEDLLDIYHDIVVRLTSRYTDGIVLQTEVKAETIEQVSVEPGLAQVTFVIRKSDPALQVEIIQPDGQTLTPAQHGVQYGGQPQQSYEEIWTASAPVAGPWQIWLNGQGLVTVWKDFYPAPATATFTPTPPPTASSTPTQTASPKPTATATTTPTSLPTASPTVTNTPAPTDTPTTMPPSSATSTLIRTPTATSTVMVSASNPGSRGSSILLWGCMGLPVIGIVTLGSGWLVLHHHQPKPHLTGVIRQITTPGGQTNPGLSPQRLDLDTLNTSEFQLVTPQTGQNLNPRLVARLDPDNEITVFLVVDQVQPDQPVLVNDRPVRTEWLLKDGDVIGLGNYKFKYENLRQRTIQRR